MDESFDASEGVQLSPELIMDKHIGSGSTADVYKLKPAEEHKNQGPTQVRTMEWQSLSITDRSWHDTRGWCHTVVSTPV